MDRVKAKIRKVGNKYCVFSEDGTKNLGCSPTREGAIKRLQQVEFFKHKDKAAMNYDNIFENLSVGDMRPENINRPNNSPSSEPHRPVNINAQPESRGRLILSEGTIAGQVSRRVLDRKDHFPVITESQAQSSVGRVMQLGQVPDWYKGTLDDLRLDVWNGAIASHPDIKFRVSLPVESVIALSDGEEAPDTSLQDIKNPEDGLQKKVPQVERPSIASADLGHLVAQLNFEDRHTVAGDILEHLEKQEEAIQKAMKVAKRLMKDGLTGDEFAGLVSFLQEDVLRDLLMQGAVATTASDRRQELINKINAKNKR